MGDKDLALETKAGSMSERSIWSTIFFLCEVWRHECCARPHIVAKLLHDEKTHGADLSGVCFLDGVSMWVIIVPECHADHDMCM